MITAVFCLASRRARHPAIKLSVLAVFALTSSAWGQAIPNATISLERQVDEAFRTLLQNPSDLGNTAAYVQLLLKGGNYEGAIAALERLMVAPNAPPSLMIEVAALYAQLRSYTMAESLLSQALANPGLSTADRQRAEGLLAEVRSAGAGSRLSGAVIFGVRQQSNATFRTDAAQIFNNGTLVNNPARPASDTDMSLAMRLQHDYDLGFKDYAVLSSGGGLFFLNSSAAAGKPVVAAFNTPYNLMVFDANSGVVFKPLSGFDGLTVRPHLLVSQVQAQGANYLSTSGIGLDLNHRFGWGGVFVTLDSQRRDFASRVDVPSAAQLGGHLTSLRTRLLYQVQAKQLLNAEITLRQNRAASSRFSFNATELRVSYAVSYSGLFGTGDWTTTPFVGWVNRDYRAADTAVNADLARRDRETRWGLTQAIPLAPRWTALLSVERAQNQANMPNFNFKNTSLSASVVYSF